MTDEQTRGVTIKRRRNLLGIKSIREFAEATGVDRAAITRAEAGEGSPGTLDRLEAWLDRFEEEAGTNAPDQAGVVTFNLSGNFGVDVTVKGPVSNLAELEASAARLLREMQDPRT